MAFGYEKKGFEKDFDSINSLDFDQPTFEHFCININGFTFLPENKCKFKRH